MSSKTLLAVRQRIRESFTRVLAATAAAALAYWLARVVLGQSQPIFAAITAIICLAPGIPSHFRQAVNLLIGVSIGIVVGELVFLLPDSLGAYDIGELRVGVAIFTAMLIATIFGLPPVVPIQAGASALLVILMGPQAAGLARYLDVLLGTAVGVSFAVLFFRARLSFKD
ncbi:FUSC family protein [Rhizobium sp.]